MFTHHNKEKKHTTFRNPRPNFFSGSLIPSPTPNPNQHPLPLFSPQEIKKKKSLKVLWLLCSWVICILIRMVCLVLFWFRKNLLQGNMFPFCFSSHSTTFNQWQTCDKNYIIMLVNHLLAMLNLIMNNTPNRHIES